MKKEVRTYYELKSMLASVGQRLCWKGIDRVRRQLLNPRHRESKYKHYCGTAQLLVFLQKTQMCIQRL